MKTKECMHCELLFDCAGKPTKNPCLQFKKRNKGSESVFGNVLRNEIERTKEDASKQ